METGAEEPSREGYRKSHPEKEVIDNPDVRWSDGLNYVFASAREKVSKGNRLLVARWVLRTPYFIDIMVGIGGRPGEKVLAMRSGSWPDPRSHDDHDPALGASYDSYAEV